MQMSGHFGNLNCTFVDSRVSESLRFHFFFFSPFKAPPDRSNVGIYLFWHTSSLFLTRVVIRLLFPLLFLTECTFRGRF